MLQLAAITLVVSTLLSAASVASFARSCSIVTAKRLLLCAMVAVAIGVLAVSFSGVQSGVMAWTFLFACGSCGCCGNAMRNLSARPPRWVHRFVIYAGYGATFAGMGAAGLWLESRAVSGWLAVGVFLGAYVLGSVCIFLAKTLTIRRTARTMPEYHASLAAGQDDAGYW